MRLSPDDLPNCPQCDAPLLESFQEASSCCPGCGLPTGLLAGKYRLLRLLGQGGAGKVYLARHVGLQKDALRVVKILAHRVLLAPGGRERLLREIQLTASLSQRSPHFVRIYDDFGELEGLGAFYVMEHLEGQTLKQHIREGGALARGQIFSIFYQLCQAMEDAHQAGVVHCDLKPENLILLEHEGEGFLKIIDLGIARSLSEVTRTGQKGALLGTPRYMSPEQCRGLRGDARSDVYSMGLILYELLAGRGPFSSWDGEVSALSLMDAHLVEEPISLGERCPGLALPEALSEVMQKALSKDARARYASAGRFWEALGPLASFWGGFAKEERSSRRARPSPQPSPQPAPAAEGTGQEKTLTLLPESAEALPASVLSSLSLEAKKPLWQQKSNLFAFSSSSLLVGRKESLGMLGRLFGEGRRLVTLLGPAGMGKTRLSLHFGALSLARYQEAGGVWFCDLSEVSSLGGVLEVISRALGVPLIGAHTLEENCRQLGYAIAGRGPVFLILDNFEQIVGLAPQTLVPWLARAPRARFLVTSRERLLVPGEACLHLPPLSEREGALLFLSRARSESEALSLEQAQPEILREIVLRLDGIPLAIEMAARVKALSLPALRERLKERLSVLKADARDTLNRRQATLRGAIDWSWELLSPVEREALFQCAVFRGGFTLQAAEAVLDLAAPPGSPGVLTLLETLQDKSLLRAFQTPLSEEARFGMYESIREYALEKLALSDKRDRIEARHQAFYLQYGELLAQSPKEDDVLFLGLLAEEKENLLAVYHRALARQPEVAARVMLALYPLLSVRGPFDVLLAILHDTVEASGEFAPRLRARLLIARGETLQRRGRYPEAERDHREALLCVEGLSEPALTGKIWGGLGYTYLRQLQNPEEAKKCFQEALRLLQESGDIRQEGPLLSKLGAFYGEMGQLKEAEEYYQKALVIARQRKSRYSEGVCLANLGNISLERGFLAKAETLFLEALRLLREVGERRNEGIFLGSLAALYMEQRRFEEAEARFQEGITRSREVGDRRNEGIALGNLGLLYLDQERYQEAEAYQREAIELHREMKNGRSEGIFLVNMGILFVLKDEPIRAEDCLAKALLLLEQFQERLHTGLCLSFLAALRAAQERVEEARTHLQEAHTILETLEDPATLMFHHVMGGHLHLALARQARERGDKPLARAHFEAVRARIRATDLPGTPQKQNPGEKTPAREFSQDVRFALRSLAVSIKKAGFGEGKR